VATGKKTSNKKESREEGGKEEPNLHPDNGEGKLRAPATKGYTKQNQHKSDRVLSLEESAGTLTLWGKTWEARAQEGTPARPFRRSEEGTPRAGTLLRPGKRGGRTGVGPNGKVDLGEGRRRLDSTEALR